MLTSVRFKKNIVLLIIFCIGEGRLRSGLKSMIYNGRTKSSTIKYGEIYKDTVKNMTFSPVCFNASFMDLSFLNHILHFYVFLTPLAHHNFVCMFLHVCVVGGWAMRIIPCFRCEEPSSIKHYLSFNFQICLQFIDIEI